MNTKIIVIVLVVVAVAIAIYEVVKPASPTGVTVVTPSTPTTGASNPVQAAVQGIASLFGSPSPITPNTGAAIGAGAAQIVTGLTSGPTQSVGGASGSPSLVVDTSSEPSTSQELALQNAYVNSGVYGPVQPAIGSPSTVSVDTTPDFSTSSDVSSNADLPSYVGADDASDGPFFS